MPAAETNGKAADQEPEESALNWDSGLAKFVGMLEADLLEWHSKERVSAKERQVKGARALEDVTAAEKQISKAPATKLVNISDSEPWQDRLKAVVNKATLQREEMRQMLELLRQHATTHLEAAGGLDFVEQLPETGEGKPLGVESGEVTKLVSRFLEVADKVGEPATVSARRRRGERTGATAGGEEAGAAGKMSKDPIKEPRKAEKKPRQPRGGQRARPPRDQESFESEYDDSRSRTPRGRCAVAPRRQQRRTPSFDSYLDEYTFSESRSPSFQARGGGRGGGPRGPPRDDRRPPRAPRGREGAPRRGGRGPDRGGDRSSGDVQADIDRFMRVNRLDGKVDKILRDLSPHTARRVMGLTGGNHTFELSGDIRDPTAVVMARVRKARDEPPPRNDRGGRGAGGGGGGYGRDPHGPPRRGQRRPRSISSRSFSPRGDRGPRDHRRGPPAGRGRRDDGYGDGRRNRGHRDQEPSANEVPLGKERDFPAKS